MGSQPGVETCSGSAGRGDPSHSGVKDECGYGFGCGARLQQ